MALRTPPSWLQNGSHPAENDRLTSTGVLWRTGGTVDYGSMVVSQSATPAMSVQIAAGHAIIAGTQATNQGFYIAYNDAATTVAIANASTTLPRIDLICATVQDSFYGGTANDQVIFQAITGTPNASPVAPATPANTVVLAWVAVAANASSITNANITDKRTQAKFAESIFAAGNVAANTIQVDGISLQTGKAIRVNDSTGAQKFAVAVDGTVTFPDGSTQITAAVFNPNLSINTQTGTAYTVLAGDAQKLITMSNAGAITLTIASNATQALPVGTQVTVTQWGDGQVNVIGASSPSPVTINSVGATATNPKTRAKFSTISLVQVSTDVWLVTGDVV